MDSATTGFGDEELLAQLSWVRRLARELVHEPSAADDVTQDVARLALEKRATFRDDARGLRTWRGAIARRVVIETGTGPIERGAARVRPTSRSAPRSTG